MGLIKILTGAVGGAIKEQTLEAFQPAPMSDTTVFAPAVPPHSNNNQYRSTEGIISNGSIIQVYDNQMMILVDGGRVVDYTAEPGYFKVENSSAPSMFNGQFKDSLKDVWTRIKFGGSTPQTQRAYYINLQEIKGLRFGSPNPVNYYDSFYNAELRLRIHGFYSIIIRNPLLFYENVVPKEYVTQNKRLDYSEIASQYTGEFMTAFSTAIGQMSAAGESIRFITSKGEQLSKYMQTALDETWLQHRGMEIFMVAPAAPVYDEKSQELIDKRNDIAMQASAVSDPAAQAAFLAASAGQSMVNAGQNEGGSLAGFMGLGMAMNQGANLLGGYQQQQMAAQQAAAQQQAAQQQQAVAQAAAGGWKCECGAENSGKFCQNCGKPKPAPVGVWKCECGAENSGKFCQNCGKPRPSDGKWQCECGAENSGKFCQNCGKPRP